MSNLADQGGWYPADDGAGPYLDWSVRLADGGREVELGDGKNAVSLDLDSDEIQQLCDEFATSLAADPSAADVLYPSDGGYIDWSVRENDTFRLEFGDGDTTAVAVQVTAEELQAIHDQLEQDIAADGV